MTEPAPARPAPREPVVEEVGAGAAAEVLSVVRAAFGPRPALDPPATALEETEGSVAAALAAGGGLVARVDGHPVGALLFRPESRSLHLRRVSVRPDAQGLGIARALEGRAATVAAGRGFATLDVLARAELPWTVRFWQRAGYSEVAREGPHLVLAKALPVVVAAPTSQATRALGARLAALLRAGDLILVSGDLGAGKTTLTQGIGEGLGVRGGITSPTFVISRVHPSLHGGPALVHVDAYRLSGLAELDDLDLDVSMEEAVTVVEWGEGIAEGLADDRLEVRIGRSHGHQDVAAEDREVSIVPVGARWAGPGLPHLVA